MPTDARIKESGEAFFFAWTQTVLGTPAAPQPVRAVGRLSVEGRPLPKSCHWLRNTVPAGAGLGSRR